MAATKTWRRQESNSGGNAPGSPWNSNQAVGSVGAPVPNSTLVTTLWDVYFACRFPVPVSPADQPPPDWANGVFVTTGVALVEEGLGTVPDLRAEEDPTLAVTGFLSLVQFDIVNYDRIAPWTQWWVARWEARGLLSEGTRKTQVASPNLAVQGAILPINMFSVGEEGANFEWTWGSWIRALWAHA